MQPKIGLLVDSALDIPEEVSIQDNVEIVPLIVTVKDSEYYDRETITPDEIYNWMNQDVIPKTASPTIELVAKSIDKLIAKGFQEIIAITISGGLSVTNNVFKQAAKLYPDVKTDVIDSKNIGAGGGLIATYAEDLIVSLTPFEEIVDSVTHSVERSRVYFYIPSLKYLRLGGRIGRVAGMVGTALSIKPIISCNPEGIYYPVAKVRSEKKAIDKLINLALADVQGHDHVRMAVAQGNDLDLMQQVTDTIHSKLPTQFVYNGDVSPALGVHTGPGLVGIAVQID
ncbi:DegV family protein [Lentilactobacillus sp. SPB1-3]|uniref:DegV family protein n=1 Tax=Lentilactobacillus terminaliae TaxID=3003483 RepID=A0ACD5DFJ5_9LACO|nr:DegV family protein [Lentilactobacillus sp. SPB1-3]MCZ0976693.1 DegV family protein [Lentilactobacillus sp. SPB1-3]